MQIAGFDVDDLADGTGKAPITWVGKELLATTHRWNPELITNVDGKYQEGTGCRWLGKIRTQVLFEKYG